MTTPRGVRSIGEKQLQKNRALIFTNENKDELLKIWSEIPNGTLHVDPRSGVISQKIYGKDYTKQLCERNELEDENKIYAGQKLLLLDK